MIGVYQDSGSWVIFLNVSLYHSGADYKLVGGKVCIYGRIQSILLKYELIGSNSLKFFV